MEEKSENFPDEGEGLVCGKATIYDDGVVYGDVTVYNHARIYHGAWVQSDKL